MINGLIFDMDGLMVDTEKLLTRFWREAAAFYGWEMKQEHVLGIRSLAGKYAGPKLQKEISPDFDYAKVRLKRIELMNAYIEKNGIEKKPGLDELIAYAEELKELLKNKEDHQVLLNVEKEKLVSLYNETYQKAVDVHKIRENIAIKIAKEI